MRHRITLWLLIAVTCLSVLNGCASDPKPAVQERKVTLKFRHFWVNEHDKPVARIFQDIISQFERSHPHVKVDFEGIDQTFHREQKLKSEMVTGNPPDIFAVFGGGEIEPYVNAERLLDLRPFLREKGLEKQFLDLSLWTFGDGVYGLPFEGFAEPIFYNKSLFAKLNLMPPKTWDQFLVTDFNKILKNKSILINQYIGAFDKTVQ